MKKFSTIVLVFLSLGLVAQEKWSAKMSQTAMTLWPDSFTLASDKTAKWRYDQGVILKGVEQVWYASGDGKWFRYIQKSMDFFVSEDGRIKGYKPDEYNIDHLNNGKLLLLLYQVTGKDKYKKAATLLRNQLRTHPRTSEGGFWHKKIYPSQMWLDGLYMGAPFYAEYAAVFGEDSAFADIARQFILMEKNGTDKNTGLLRHGWDEAKVQQWADKKTGLSPHVWGRSLGWFGMALVDVLDHFPLNHPQRPALIAILNRFVKSVKGIQDPATGLWYDLAALPRQAGNYVEASASSMLVYTLAKASRMGYVPASNYAAAQKGYKGILKEFIATTAEGQVNLKGTVAVSGLGGNPYRDGSIAYYLSEPVIVNDPKGMGAFILCAAEMELNESRAFSKGKRVVLDNFYNNEQKKESDGHIRRWHYTWDDKSNGGFALLGHLFRTYGASTQTLQQRPTAAALAKASVYIIVDPDTEKENPKPSFIERGDIRVIQQWVKAGGVLVLLGNDTGNAEREHFNELAAAFGIRFMPDSRNRVQGDKFSDGAVVVTLPSPVFSSPWNLYIKEYSSLQCKAPAKPLVSRQDHVVMATARYGMGTVFVLGDPWIYNEYLDGRKLPGEFQNYPAATDWVKWLIKSAK